jgi:hypothetical protein
MKLVSNGQVAKSNPDFEILKKRNTKKKKKNASAPTLANTIRLFGSPNLAGG